MTDEALTIIPLGGVGEIGKNMTAIAFGEDMILIDAGLAFPDEDMLGIDIVIPDVSYVLENRERVRGIFITHGHEDHIGGIPYLLRDLQAPVHATGMALGLIRVKLAEQRVALPAGSRVFVPGEVLKAGVFSITPFRVNHSIADSVGFAIETPVGTVVHSGDFKFDHTPVDGRVADFHRIAEIGDRGVTVLLSDSTNADQPGYTPSERTVGVKLDEIMAHARQRVLVATFASNVHRIQQVIHTAYAHGRRVAVVGRSIENTVSVALELGYLDVPEGTLVNVEEMRHLPGNRLAILTTGSQGEPLSALTRISTGDHRWVEIVPGDTVVIAATPVPGNEKMVFRTVNNLYRLGAEVILGRAEGVHVSGHASQEELKLMLNLVRPKYLIPVHGEPRHLVRHGELAESLGMPAENVLIGDNGTVFEIRRDGARVSGRVQAGAVMVDGTVVGDVGSVVLRDRRQLAQDGILVVVVAIDQETGAVVGGPEVISRGFVYVRESEALMEEARQRAAEAVAVVGSRPGDWGALKNAMRDAVGRLLFERTGRRPMLLPIVVEADLPRL